MTYTFDKSSGSDSTIETRVGSGDDTHTIYAANGSDVITTVTVNGHRFMRYAPANWSISSSGAGDSDRLVATDDNDVIFWDLGTASGMTSGSSGSRISDDGTRARLYNANDSRDFEIFDLRDGNDVLNLTYKSGSGSPGDYDGSVTVYGGGGNDILALSDGDDLVFGGANSDTIYGGGGLDRLFGDDGSTDINETSGGNDTIYAREGSNATLWGEGGNDYLEGSGEGVETFYGGAGNDTIHNWSGYGDVAYGGSGDDRIITADTAYGGDGNDYIDGGFGGTGIEGRDTIFGDAGNDTIYGGDGHDTIYGGSGDDYVYGGLGDDVIFDDGSAMGFMSADGDDIVVMNFDNAGLNKALSVTGVDGPSDGADQVYALGRYNSVSFALGGANDIFVGSATTGVGGQIDRVQGQSGDDIISSWEGNDVIDGGADNDALWGGAGSDTVYGGDGTDYLYGGWGDNDVLVGGGGTDYYYWSRTDGQGDQIFDDFRGTPIAPGQQADNVLVVFPDFDSTEVNGDGLCTGSGVFETDHDLYDLAGGDDMVRLTDIDGAAGSMYRLTVLNGDGSTNYVEFDQRDVQTILLWNNDAAPGTQVIQTYAWDAVDGRYEFIS